MKVLLFTHKNDIDGMGPAVLAMLSFIEVDYELCGTFDLDQEIAKYYDSGKIYEYDIVFVADLCPSIETLSQIDNDINLRDKFLVFDHHKTALSQGCDKYPFVTLRVSDEEGLCSGTSLFYEYLIKKGLLSRERVLIATFVELIRRYDTWEWKNKYNDESAHDLSILFDSIGPNAFIRLMYQKLIEGKISKSFSFNDLENLLITNKKSQVEVKLSSYAKRVQYIEVQGLKAGVVFIDYEYRNELAEYFRQHGYDMDFAILIAIEQGSISYRSIKDNVDVSLIAESFGGKGHAKAASSTITGEQQSNMIRALIKEKR